jgi:hypothetical protein
MHASQNTPLLGRITHLLVFAVSASMRSPTVFNTPPGAAASEGRDFHRNMVVRNMEKQEDRKENGRKENRLISLYAFSFLQFCFLHISFWSAGACHRTPN